MILEIVLWLLAIVLGGYILINIVVFIISLSLFAKNEKQRKEWDDKFKDINRSIKKDSEDENA